MVSVYRSPAGAAPERHSQRPAFRVAPRAAGLKILLVLGAVLDAGDTLSWILPVDIDQPSQRVFCERTRRRYPAKAARDASVSAASEKTVGLPPPDGDDNLEP